MKIFRISLVVSALALAGVGVFNCGGSDSDNKGGSGGSASGGGKGGAASGSGGTASGGSGGSASGGSGGTASGGSGGTASGGSGGTASGGSGGTAAGGSGGTAAGGSGGSAAGGAGGAPAVAVTFDGKIKSIFMEKCSNCHTGGGSGGINLTMYADTQKAGNAAICGGKKVGECALIRIKNGSMPKDKGCSGNPVTDAAKSACLTKAQQDDIQAWITGGMKEK